MGKEKFLLFLVLILGLGLRLIKLDQSFWLDEASQAQLSSLSLSQIWSNRQADFHPPLFYILAHYWLQFGRSEVWLRLLPVAFGVANIYVIYLLGRQIKPGSKLGLIAAFLLSINQFHVYYSQEFRSYSLLALLGTLSMYLFFKKKYIWTAVINAALLYTHYSSIFLIAAQFIISPITIYYSLFTLFLYLPWLPQFLIQLSNGVNIDQYLPGWRQVLSLSPIKAIPLIFFKFVAGRINLLPKWIYAVYIAFVLSVTAGGILLARGQRRFLYSWLFIPIILMIVISLIIPQTQPFRLIYVLPAVLILLAEATVRFPKLFLILLIYIAIVGNYTYFTRPRLQREQWRQAIDYLRGQNKTVMVKFFDKFAPFYWYGPDIKVVTVIPESEKEFYFMEYLTGLTDPNFQVEKNLRDLGYTQRGGQNFEGVGYIYKYVK